MARYLYHRPLPGFLEDVAGDRGDHAPACARAVGLIEVGLARDPEVTIVAELVQVLGEVEIAGA